eukprot:scaffold39117_cov148-Skeletonema_marinoi.AAC.8
MFEIQYIIIDELVSQLASACIAAASLAKLVSFLALAGSLSILFFPSTNLAQHSRSLVAPMKTMMASCPL